MSEKVSIAQALRRIKKLKGQIGEHTTRATANVSYVSTKVPAFRFDDEMTGLVEAKTAMIDLETRVAVANATALITWKSHNWTLAKAIRHLQETKSDIALLKGLNLRAETVKEREQEWSDEEMKTLTRVTEVTYVSDLTEAERDSRVKTLQDQFEELNNLVEDANHSVSV